MVPTGGPNDERDSTRIVVQAAAIPGGVQADAVRLVVSEEPFMAAAAAVGVSEQTLRHWHMPDQRRSRPSVAKTPRWTNCVRRTSDCDANCGGPRVEREI